MTLSANSDPKKTLETVAVPGFQHLLGELGRIRKVDLANGRATVEIELGFPCSGLSEALKDEICRVLETEHGVTSADVTIHSKIVAHGVQRNLKPLPGVKNVIAIASGKGGVGKSTTAVNLALALAADGARTGVLDADIYGPSIPLMLGLVGENPTTDDGKSMNPLQAHELQVMSIGFLVDDDQPMVWRGPMVTQALNQMLQQTLWNELDYLIVDMPPGTGDIQLTLAQQVPVSGAVIVTTPQDIALLDAGKGLQMFRKVSVPVLGVIENMSTHVCTSCGHEEALFGAGGGDWLAGQYDVELLGALPLDLKIRQQTDGGTPTVVAEPDGAPALAYREAARRMAARLAVQDRDYSARFPKIVVENT